MEINMWKSYFYNIQKKYSMRVSKTMPLVIRLDGKNVTKNKSIDLLDREKENSFSNALEKTAKYFTEKYNCFAIFGSDEISIICQNPKVVVKDLDSDENYHSNEIIALFTQYFFDYFNEFDKHKKIYWHGKCFSISTDKIISYVKHRSRIIQNVMTTYFLVKKGMYNGNEKLKTRINTCNTIDGYNTVKDFEKGMLYYNGKRINLDKFLEGQVVETNQIDIDNLFSDLM